MMDTLGKYQISFASPFFFGETIDSIDSVNPWFSSFISDHNTVRRARNLLGAVNSILAGAYPQGVLQTQSLYMALLTSDETKIYKDLEEWEYNNSIDPDFILPTSDFKEIVEAWIDYLSKENAGAV